MTAKQKNAVDYFDDLQTLRQSMTINRKDGETSRRLNKLKRPETRFRYFVDSNVVTAFTNPAAKIDYFNPLKDWLQPKELGTATATVLAEFLFSGMLPGQELDSRPFMTPAHYNELAGMAKAVGEKAKKNAHSIDRPSDDDMRRLLAEHKKEKDNAIQQLRDLQRQFKQGKVAPSKTKDHLLSNLSTLLLSPGPSLDPLFEAAAEARSFENLLRDDHVIPAESQPWFHGGIFSPDRTRISDWYKALQTIANFERKERIDRNIHNDAVSMVQLFGLQEDAPLDVQYVFITADDILTRACQNHLDKIGGSKPLLLRHPWHYIPLINLRTMSRLSSPPPESKSDVPSGIDAQMGAIFDKIETALDQLLEEGDRVTLASNWPERRGELTANWSDAASCAVVLNAKVLEARQEDEGELIKLITTSPDFRQATLTQLDDVIHRIFTGHMRLSQQGSIGMEVVEYVRNDHAGPRAPLLFVPHIFKPFTGDLSINEYLTKIVRGQQTVSRDLLRSESGETCLFAACVALVRKNWSAAHHFAERALELLKALHGEHGEMVCEARYCYAMTLRFNMSGIKHVNEARELLNSCATEHVTLEGKFLLTRSLSEAAALLGTALYKANKEGKTFVNLKLENRLKLVAEAKKLLAEARGALDDIRLHGSQSQWELMVQRLGLQIYSNIASLAIYEAWVLKTDFADIDALRESSATLHSRMNAWTNLRDFEGRIVPLPSSVEVPSSVLDVLLAESGTERIKLAESALNLVIEKLKDATLPEMDRQEFEFYQKCLKEIFRL